MKTGLIICLQVLMSNFLAKQSDTLKILFIGDIMQHQTQLDAARNSKGNINDPLAYDYSDYFKHVKERFEKADFAVANMETSFARPPYTGYPSFSSPFSLIEASRDAGIDLFLAANNHICDKGERGIKGALDLYDSLGVLHTGIYRDAHERETKNPIIVTVKGFKIAFLNYTYGTNGIRIPEPYIVNTLDTTVIKEDLKKAAVASPDFIIACPHWGVEYVLFHSKEQEKMEKFFYDNGVNIIIGSHPHVPQDYRTEQGPDNEIRHITVYSLGNAISNMTAENTRIGIIAQIMLTKDRAGNKRILPPKIEYIWTSRPKMFDKNFTILPIEDYLDKPGLFRDKREHRNMLKHYLRFTK